MNYLGVAALTYDAQLRSENRLGITGTIGVGKALALPLQSDADAKRETR
jgi:hypothetical protein